MSLQSFLEEMEKKGEVLHEGRGCQFPKHS